MANWNCGRADPLGDPGRRWRFGVREPGEKWDSDFRPCRRDPEEPIAQASLMNCSVLTASGG